MDRPDILQMCADILARLADLDGEALRTLARFAIERDERVCELERQVTCSTCGDQHAAPCTWAATCGECLRTDAEMLRARLCVECDEVNERVAARDRAEAAWESHGDWLRDQQKDGAL